MLEIIYRHQDFVIINKPPALSVHKDDQDIGLTQMLATQLGVAQVWLVHRLDKVTSGLLILALNEQAAASLSGLFAEHKIQKTYLALATDKPKKKQGLVIGDMQKARRGAWKLLKSRENPAITRFYSVSCEPNLRLFILQPQTGKTHQLRVMMKSLGSPILGDELYGGKVAENEKIKNIDRTYLHAYRLDFCYQGAKFSIECVPKCGVFFQENSVLSQIAQIDLKKFT
ncbi:RNA pseudouridine synthase [Pasteurellaceae bacterium Pebbles2]|nr:RNA pseudouridine synthase [Pasteurellaceae bacterium Pebbles2]